MRDRHKDYHYRDWIYSIMQEYDLDEKILEIVDKFD